LTIVVVAKTRSSRKYPLQMRVASPVVALGLFLHRQELRGTWDFSTFLDARFLLRVMIGEGDKWPPRQLWVKGCLPEDVGVTAGILQISCRLAARVSRWPWRTKSKRYGTEAKS
jgi:hypothetical protein